MTELTELLLAFWAGGLVASVFNVWLEWEKGTELPPVALAFPWRFALALLGLVVFWPAGLVLVTQRVRRERVEREAEEAEWERIEAMRKPLASVVYCPGCAEPNEVPAPSSRLVSKVVWLCSGCLYTLEAPANHSTDCDYED